MWIKEQAQGRIAGANAVHVKVVTNLIECKNTQTPFPLQLMLVLPLPPKLCTLPFGIVLRLGLPTLCLSCCKGRCLCPRSSYYQIQMTWSRFDTVASNKTTQQCKCDKWCDDAMNKKRHLSSVIRTSDIRGEKIKKRHSFSALLTALGLTLRSNANPWL